MIRETEFDDTLYYIGDERQIRDWPVVGFLKQWRDDRFLESGMNLAGSEGKVDNIGDC